MNITIKYFASLREKSQRNEEELQVSAEESLTKIYQTLASRYDFPLSTRQVKFAVNNEYVEDQYQLKENDVVVFIPPVAGG
jgi:molybdopterin synthase sulfur carrier subunit